MEYILVTLKMPQQTDMDLKIPWFISGEAFLQIMRKITGSSISVASKIQAEPLGRILDNSHSFFDEGVGNGALLTVL